MAVEDMIASREADERFVEVALMLAEGYRFFQDTARPTVAWEEDYEACQLLQGADDEETMVWYLKSLRDKHDQRHRELIDTYGEDNVWVGPSNIVEADGDLLPEPTHAAFYVRTVTRDSW